MAKTIKKDTIHALGIDIAFIRQISKMSLSRLQILRNIGV